MKEEDKKLIVLWIIYFVYMVIGAVLFSELEYENENEQIRYFTALMSRIQKEHNLSDTVMDTLSFTHDDACSKGIRFQGPFSNKWDFAGSFYFVGTVITTIGFGFISPITRGGQICFIPYALLGIPLNILLFNTLLERTVLWISDLLTWGRKLLAKKECKPDPKLESCKNHFNAELSSVYIGCVSFSALAVFILLISILFMYIEDWNYFEAVYFCVVAFTTVGFGDFVPSSSHSEHGKNLSSEYKVGNWILIVVGLIFMYPALAIAASLYKELITCLMRKCFLRTHKRQVAPQTRIDQATPNSLSENYLIDDLESVTENALRGSTVCLRSPGRASRCSVIQLGTVSTVEESLMKSRVSLRDCTQSGDKKSELDNLIALEARLTKEYQEAFESLQKRKFNLMVENEAPINLLTQTASPAESGIFLKVNSHNSQQSNYRYMPNSHHSFVSS